MRIFSHDAPEDPLTDLVHYSGFHRDVCHREEDEGQEPWRGGRSCGSLEPRQSLGVFYPIFVHRISVVLFRTQEDGSGALSGL